ncbi:murein hydrolase activator EnvC family protein [Hellea balneolensis]|uniref:murein hydrolase activator EnvC family protein n=1 Tax=Hellea balneolensis TaxID=287478 RepID=UPI00040E6732|nr:peptidoglycan DD-metalloendopeptidase family protein [Hellea balneolensis]
MRALFIALILGLATAHPHAQTADPQKLESLTKAEEDARKKEAELTKKQKTIAAELSKLKKDLVRTATEAEKYERQGRSLESQLSELDTDAAALNQAIYGDRQKLTQLLAALQRIESNPPPALASQPKDAAEAARAARLMSSLSADLRKRAELLTSQLEISQTLREDIKDKRTKLSANETRLKKRRSNINKLVGQKSDLKESVTKDREAALQEVSKLASEAKSLRELIESFEAATANIGPRIKPGKNATKPKKSISTKPVKLPKGVKRFASAKGTLRAPVPGRMTRNYGSGEKGMTVAARSKASVIAPYAGRIEFAGAFKNYDNVVILNVGDGYFILMTGMGETYVETGENVRIGEPLGLMPFNAKDSNKLYIELRKNGGTINPKPWLGKAYG